MDWHTAKSELSTSLPTPHSLPLSTPPPTPQTATLCDGVPLLELGRENGPIHSQVVAALSEVFASGRFVLGPECERLEQQFAELSGTEFAVGCASGSDALLLALMANDVGPGDEVIVPSFTFFATASAAWRLGAKPVFVDIDPRTFCIDPSHLQRAIGPKTRAILPVHLFGQCCDMDSITEIADAHQLPIVEDCAQAVSATYHGRSAGSIGQIGCFSFYPTKNLGGCGDGGMLTTSDESLYRRLKLLRAHGMEPKYMHHVVGINSRLDTMQAAVLNVKMPHLLAWNDQRATNAANYDRLFRAAGLATTLGLPQSDPACCHVWNQYTIRVRDGLRDALRDYLAGFGIGSEVYYPIPLHQQPCFASIGYTDDDLPETVRASNEVLSLPIFPELTPTEQQFVVDHVAEFFATRG